CACVEYSIPVGTASTSRTVLMLPTWVAKPMQTTVSAPSTKLAIRKKPAKLEDNNRPLTTVNMAAVIPTIRRIDITSVTYPPPTGFTSTAKPEGTGRDNGNTIIKA